MFYQNINRMQAAQRAKKCCFLHGDLDLWPWHSNSSKPGIKHVFRVNLAQIRLAVPWHISYTNKKPDWQRQKQNLPQFTVCSDKEEKQQQEHICSEEMVPSRVRGVSREGGKLLAAHCIKQKAIFYYTDDHKQSKWKLLNGIYSRCAML